MKKERRTAGDRRTETTPSSREARGATGRKREKKRGAVKSWGRREKSRLDMGLCAVLLICLSQAELGRVWAEEHEGKTPSSMLTADMHRCQHLKQLRKQDLTNDTALKYVNSGYQKYDLTRMFVTTLGTGELQTCFSFFLALFWVDFCVCVCVTGSTEVISYDTVPEKQPSVQKYEQHFRRLTVAVSGE